jgi:hypothetical protein
MSTSLSEIGLDSNCLSYVIDALEGVKEPADVLAPQRLVFAVTRRFASGRRRRAGA